MMPDLGKYAVSVLSSYATTLSLLAALVLLTLRSGRKARRELEAVERKRKSDG
jgi:heme exporter protein D